MAAASEYSASVPDLIKQYVVYFYRHIRCAPQESAQRSPRRRVECLLFTASVRGDGCMGQAAGFACCCVISGRCCLECTTKPFCVHRERNIREIFSMYEVSFATLSERFYKNTTWPPVEYIAELVDHDHVFCLLYKARWHSSEYHRTLICYRQSALQEIGRQLYRTTV